MSSATESTLLYFQDAYLPAGYIFFLIKRLINSILLSSSIGQNLPYGFVALIYLKFSFSLNPEKIPKNSSNLFSSNSSSANSITKRFPNMENLLIPNSQLGKYIISYKSVSSIFSLFSLFIFNSIIFNGIVFRQSTSTPSVFNITGKGIVEIIFLQIIFSFVSSLTIISSFDSLLLNEFSYSAPNMNLSRFKQLNNSSLIFSMPEKGIYPNSLSPLIYLIEFSVNFSLVLQANSFIIGILNLSKNSPFQ